MKYFALVGQATFALCLAFSAFAQDNRKYLPNQAANDDVELLGTVLLDPAAIEQELGADLGPGYVAVKIKITPTNGRPLRVSPDDFTLISRKNGDQSGAITPHQIAGKGVMVVHPAKQQPGGLGTVSNGPIWGGIGGAQPRKFPGKSSGGGNTSVEGGTSSASVDQEKSGKESPLLAVLQAKGLPEKESKDPSEGLLYFLIEGKKLKPKDMALRYVGPSGRLVMDFK